jgi:hypothetical protein
MPASKGHGADVDMAEGDMIDHDGDDDGKCLPGFLFVVGIESRL